MIFIYFQFELPFTIFIFIILVLHFLFSFLFFLSLLLFNAFSPSFFSSPLFSSSSCFFLRYCILSQRDPNISEYSSFFLCFPSSSFLLLTFFYSILYVFFTSSFFFFSPSFTSHHPRILHSSICKESDFCHSGEIEIHSTGNVNLWY